MSDDPFRLGLDRFEEILPRYATEGPRYTSYPTAPVWNESYGPEAYRKELGREDIDPSDPLSIYVHVPFCESLCHYCACNKVITRDHSRADKYLDMIEREVAAVHSAVRVPRRATQHHWGGGTPTYLSPEQVQRLFGCVNAAFPIAHDAEVSIEVDPRVTTDEHIVALRECGFNRISMGVQDFEPKVQEAVHRIQPADKTGELLQSARSRGFESVNFDLIYGLPYQRPETFARTLDTVMELAPDRIALYSYAHVTWVAKQQRGFERKDLPNAETKLAIMLLAIRRFLDAGYIFIGLDHFAKPDDELATALRDRTLRRNFMGHTTQAGVDMIGFGPSAIGELRRSYAQSQRDLGAWEQAVEEDGVATMRGHMLSDDDIERRWVISRIMCLGELRAEEFEREFGREFSGAFASELTALKEMVDDGLVTIAGDGSIEVTSLGRLFVRNVAMHFDAYLPEQLRSGKQMFSKTV
ncbi:MAG: oxygen-independent coproporphyrinogen III oxidase [Deltaproteobacteria bacterium]|nr:oxygen-independent coproporphyrinogen III oxidase [Deltaproteobacteria bacterium]